MFNEKPPTLAPSLADLKSMLPPHPDLTDRLRRAFAAWGMRSLGDEAADEIDRLRHDNARLLQTITQELSKP